MPEDWSAEEVAATVADYLVMLKHELLREPYNKKDHNRHLQELLNNRSAGAIEFKHCNISAVLLELGFVCIDGYKRRPRASDRSQDHELRRDDAVLRKSARGNGVGGTRAEL